MLGFPSALLRLSLPATLLKPNASISKRWDAVVPYEPLEPFFLSFITSGALDCYFEAVLREGVVLVRAPEATAMYAGFGAPFPFLHHLWWA